MLTANVLALLFILPSVGGMAAAYAGIWGWWHLGSGADGWHLLPVLLGFLIAIVVHEAIHGITWVHLSGRPLSVVRYGFKLATLTPYAHLTEPLPIRPYRLGVMMPGLVLGLIPCLAALALGRPGLMLCGLLMTAVAGGDMVILWLLRRVDPSSQVQDHPNRAGCWVLDAGKLQA